MTPILLVLMGAAALPPRPTVPAHRPAAQQQPPARATAQNIQPTSPGEPRTAYDTTVAAIVEVGTRVAEVRSTYDLYRRAVFNETVATVIERADMFRGACRAMAESARQGQRRLCRACLPRATQAPVDQYRSYLPALQRLGEQCASRVSELKARGTQTAQGAALKADVRPTGTRLVAGLQPYEARLMAVRVAMGWVQGPAAPPRRRSP